MTPRQLQRLNDKLARLASELYADAARLRQAGYERSSDHVSDAAAKLADTTRGEFKQ